MMQSTTQPILHRRVLKLPNPDLQDETIDAMEAR
jgi:hypothetical protein